MATKMNPGMVQPETQDYSTVNNPSTPSVNPFPLVGPENLGYMGSTGADFERSAPNPFSGIFNDHNATGPMAKCVG